MEATKRIKVRSVAFDIYLETGQTCSCCVSNHPPCSFCEGMTATEVDIYVADGAEELIQRWRQAEENELDDDEAL